MIIYSFNFIICFFLLFVIYWLACKNKSHQNWLLLIASYVFYGLWEWRCLILLFIVSIVAHGAGLYFKKAQVTERYFLHHDSRWWVSFGAIVCCLGILCYFKYTNFFLQSINSLTNWGEQKSLNILLPVGISFYTFSAISYIVDCYQKKIEPVTDIVAGLLYTSFFPAILSGPIHKATEQIPQYLKKREFDYNIINGGFKDYVWGAFIKLCVADRLGMYVDAVYGNVANHSGTTLLITSVCYTLQIYADFAGYSLMAIGCGKMLGIRLQNNFNLPYFSKTITEFWSKWHMSLTGWFKNYLYFPLGGNRVSKPRWILNIMTVFLLSGLWHGAAYTFIIWGAIHGVAQVIEKLIYGKKIKTLNNNLSVLNVLRIVITFCIVSFAWIFFRIPRIEEAFTVIGKIFTAQGEIFLDPILFLALISLFFMVVKDSVEQYGINIKLFYSKYAAVRYLSVTLLISYILLFGVLEGGQFIYFQF